jgi:hypothetical protein
VVIGSILVGVWWMGGLCTSSGAAMAWVFTAATEMMR